MSVQKVLLRRSQTQLYLKTVFSMILLGLAVGFMIYLGTLEKNPEFAFKMPEKPEEYMSNVSVWSYTETGDLKHFISAIYWAYVPEKQTSLLTIPHLTVYRPDKTHWKIDAKRGLVQQPTLGNIEHIELLDTVVLQRPAMGKAVPIKVETEAIRYHPKKQTAETERMITMTKPDLKITGVGMRASLKNNTVELLENVKTSYMPGS